MKVKKYIAISLPELGCAVDAITYLDTACSGKQMCRYVAVGTDLGQTKPCRAQLIPYLEIEYVCIEGKRVYNDSM